MGLMQLYKKWSNIDFIELATDVLIGMDEYIADLNRKQMEVEGIRADGSDIKPDYSEITDFIKTLKGQETGHVTLKDTGDFHKSITADVYGDSLLLDATDSKTPDLLDKYGDVLGLTDENIIKVRSKFMPLYINAILSKL